MKLPAILLSLCSLAAPSFSQGTPASWYDHAVIYEIYPRSFQDSNGDGVGDLKGVTSRLDYLKGLGVDAIWLTPFFPSPNLDFGYDISNYTDVAPEYGTMADWDELVKQAHTRGIRVLVDFVVNHTSDQHPWFKESRSSRDNPKRDWYIWHNGGPANQPPNHWQSIFGGSAWTFDPATSQWFYHIFLPQQPDVNWANPGLRQAMFDVARFWLDHGASGFRLDATPYLFEDPLFPDDPNPNSGAPIALKPYNSGRPENHEVLRQLRAVLNSHGNDAVLLGESTTANITDLAAVYGANRDEIQLPMDFLLGNLTALNGPHFKQQLDDAETHLKGQTPVFFFSSHDHPRQWSVFGDGVHNDGIAKLTAAVTLLPRGTALVYYGEELGMATMPKSELAGVPTGPKRPRADLRDGERTPMQWSASAPNAGFTSGVPWLPVESTSARVNVDSERADPHSIYNWYAALIALRKTPTFRDGAYLPLASGNPGVVAFARTLPDGSGALVILNTSRRSEQVHLAGVSADLASSKLLLASPEVSAPTSLSFSVQPFGVLVSTFTARK